VAEISEMPSDVAARRRPATGRRFSIARRLAGSFAVVIAMLAAASYVALAGLVDVHTRLHRVKDDEAKARSALRLASALCDEYAHIAHTIILGDASHLPLFDEAVARLDRLAAEVRSQARKPEQRAAIDEMLAASRAIEGTFRDDVLPRIARGAIKDLPRYHDQILQLTTRAQARADELVRASETAMEDFRAHAQTVQHGVFRWTLLVHLAALLAAALIGVYVYRSIARPVTSLASAASRIAAGDLETQIAIERDDELGRLAAQFNVMTTALREHQAQLIQTEKLAGLGRVAAGLAHEINNPVGVILGYVKLMRRRGAGELDADLAIVEDEAERCRQVVDGLLDLTRPRPLERTAIDVRTLADDVVRRVTASAAVAPGQVCVEGAATVHGSDAKLRQVLTNLVKNAVEASGAGGTLRVEIRQERGRVSLDVSDTGPGVKDQDRPHLFEPFFTTKPSGTGLGLAVSRGIARAHGGDVELLSSSVAGTTFRLTLPAEPGARA
jgi:two-component system NtrC family sensor kinase